MSQTYTMDVDRLLRTHRGDPHGDVPMIGYLRVSTAREDMISPEVQADAIDRYARAGGRRIVQWVADLDLSGREFGTRKIVSIIEAIESRTAPEQAREIGVWKFSRFGRNRALNALYLGRLEKAGGALISATEQVDATTSIGKFTRGMMMELAAFESDRIGEGWRDVHAYRLERGLPNSGRPRFGYVRRGRIQIGPEHWVPDPEDPVERYEPGELAPVLARMYREAAAGRSGYSIVRWLNGDRVPGPTGTVGRWTHSTLWPLLDSGFGAGLLRVHDPACTTHDPDKYGWCRNRTWIEGAHAHVFDDDAERDRVWEAYRRRRQESPALPPRSREARHELTGVVTCAWCGATMAAHRNNGPRTGYSWRCAGVTRGTCERTNSVSDRLVRAAVRDLLQREHQRLAELEEAAGAHQIEQGQAPERDRGAEIDAELEALQRRLDRLTDRYAADDIPRGSYVRTRDRYLAEQGALEAERAELEARPEEKRPRDYVPVVRGLLEEWETLPTWGVNRVLRELIEVRARRLSRTEAYVTLVTAWGVEETVPAAERMGTPVRKTPGQ